MLPGFKKLMLQVFHAVAAAAVVDGGGINVVVVIFISVFVWGSVCII